MIANSASLWLKVNIYAGISGQKVNDMFDEGNEKQNWDKLENLVAEQNAKHKFWKEPNFG